MKSNTRESIKDIIKTYGLIALMTATVICTSLLSGPKPVQASEIDKSTEISTVCTSTEVRGSDVGTTNRHPGMCEIELSSSIDDLHYYQYVKPGAEYVVPANVFPVRGYKFRFWMYDNDLTVSQKVQTVHPGDIIVITQDCSLLSAIY